MENVSVWKRIILLAVREWRLLTHRRLYLFSMVIAPVFCVVFFLTLMNAGLPNELPTAVVDLDKSSVSRQLVRTLDNFKQSHVAVYCTSFHEARKLMQQGKVYGIYCIPENLERDVLSFRQPKISFYTNNAYIVAGSLEFQDLKTISVLGSAAVGKEMRVARGQTEEQAMIELQPIKLDTHPLSNPWVNYTVYLCNTILPGLLCVLIVLTTVFALGMEIKERRSRELLDIAGDDMLVVYVGKLLPHTLIYFLIITFIEVSLYGIMGFPCKNGLLSMLIVSYLFVMACQSFAIMLFSIKSDMKVALSLSAFFTMLSFSASGFTFPVDEMPWFLQPLTNIFPLRQFLKLYIDNALDGRAFCYSWPSYVAMMIFLFMPLIFSWRLRNALKNDVYIP